MKTLLLILLFSLTASASAFELSIGIGPGGVTINPGYGPGSGPGNEPEYRPGRVCFFQDVGYQGQSFCVRAGEQDRNLVRSGWNDMISSIWIEGDATVQVFTDIRFEGSSLSLDHSVPDIRAYHFFWNDAISSFITEGDEYEPPTPPARGRVCFFDQVGFRGESFCLIPGQEKANLGRIGWSDRISSVLVEGRASAYLYANKNFNGRNRWVSQSVRDLRAFSDRATSVQVVREQN